MRRGGIHALNADPNIAALQAYTIDLLKEIEEESGQNIGLHMTGGLTLAGTKDRWEWLQATFRVFQSIGIDDCYLVTYCENGTDHDTKPMTFSLPYKGLKIDSGFYFRKRSVNKESSFFVLG